MDIETLSIISRLAGAWFVDLYPSSGLPMSLLSPVPTFLASHLPSSPPLSCWFPFLPLYLLIFHPSIRTSVPSRLYNPEMLLSLLVCCELLVLLCISSILPFFSYFWMLPVAKPRPSSSLSSEGLKTFLLHCWFWFCKILIMRIMLIIFLLWHNLVWPDLRKRYLKWRRRNVVLSVHISVRSFLFLICFILLLFFMLFDFISLLWMWARIQCFLLWEVCWLDQGCHVIRCNRHIASVCFKHLTRWNSAY